MKRSFGVAAAALCASLVVLPACSSSTKHNATGDASTTARGTVARPAGPAADMATELTGGKGVFIGEATPPDFTKIGYTQREFAARGTATSYKVTGALSQDGRWTFTPDTTAPYKTRVLVRAPADASKFSGNVIVEWLNVSGGLDANPDWTSTSEEIVRSGDVWVGVSAQRIGVVGGPVLVKVSGPGSEQQGVGLVKTDPARYGTLSHPGDGYAYDIFTQVARAVRAGAGLGGLKPQHVIAAGESQSAFALVSYYNGVQPLTHVFDGFFVHSRGAGGLPIVGPGKYADLSGSIGKSSTIFRTDQPDAPVMDIQTETDVASILNSYAARQADTNRFRLWEVAGTAHADAHLLGANAKYIDCGVPINDGAMHIVAKAALHALKAWVANGQLPVSATRIRVTAAPKVIVQRNRDGIAIGGIRTPPVDVPVSALSGAPGPNPSVICLLLGSSKPFSAARLAQLYPSRAIYQHEFEAAADAAIKAGYVLAADRDALLAFAEPSRIAG